MGMTGTRFSHRTFRPCRRRQAESKDGTLSRAANDTDGSPVGFDDRLRNRQTHTGAVDTGPLLFPAIEFFKDVVDFPVVDPRPLVRNTDVMESAPHLCCDPNGLAR